MTEDRTWDIQPILLQHCLYNIYIIYTMCRNHWLTGEERTATAVWHPILQNSYNTDGCILPKIIPDYNGVPQELVAASTLVCLKSRLICPFEKKKKTDWKIWNPFPSPPSTNLIPAFLPLPPLHLPLTPTSPQLVTNLTLSCLAAASYPPLLPLVHHSTMYSPSPTVSHLTSVTNSRASCSSMIQGVSMTLTWELKRVIARL